MRHILPLLLLCSTAMGQGFLSYQVPDLSGLPSGSNFVDIPSTIGLGISNRWISAHFATNATGITDWPDETNSFHWVLGASSSSMTNSTKGIGLDKTHFMLGTNFWNDPAKVVFLMTLNLDDQNGANCLLFQDNGFGLGNGIPAVFPGPTGNMNFNVPSFVCGSLGHFNTNIMYNLVYEGSTQKMYTNGVSVGTFANNFNLPSASVNIGSFAVNNSGYDGYIKELIIFTNTTITSSQISNLNYYATHYPY